MDNVKIKTSDVASILDTKILASNSHPAISVSQYDNYDSVLSSIVNHIPTLLQKQALDASVSPSAGNEYITQSALSDTLAAKIPWKTIGLPGSGTDFEGDTNAVFTTALASGYKFFQIRAGTYNFSNSVVIPENCIFIGDSSAATILTGTSVFDLDNNDVYLGFLSVSNLNVLGNRCQLENVVVTESLLANSVSDLLLFACAFPSSTCTFDTVTDSFINSCLFDKIATDVLNLSNCINVSVTSCVVKNGNFKINTCVNVKALASHFNDGLTLTTSPTTLLRANTPNTLNNDADDFQELLQYIGSPVITASTPTYSNNYAGPPGEDLTSRASALDLLTQWRYEERNFQLTSTGTVSWNPTVNLLTSTTELGLYSSHRSSYWVIPDLSVTIASNAALYYVLDRNLNNTPLTLTPQTAALGSIPNNSSNRQVWVLAFCVDSTLFWRGGGGTRFPATTGNTGEYFIDGTSKSLIDYIGADDYNDSNPYYSNNFVGIEGESLTVRLGKTDTLIKRLFEYSNVSVYLQNDGYIKLEGDYEVSLIGTLLISLPHVAGRIYCNSYSWSLNDGQLVYLTYNQGDLAGSDTAITSSTVATTVPLPNNYPGDGLGKTKYFVLARRKGTSVILWDGSVLTLGGRYPIPENRLVVPTSAPAALTDNVQWDGTNLLWENIAVATSTGATIDRNRFPNQTTALAGLTALGEGEGIVVTHSWNDGAAGYVSLEKITLPVGGLLQNQFLWAYRRSGKIILP